MANEVKELANQMAKATEEISGRIAAIQSDSTSAVDAIERIGEVIDRISSILSTIASAVEEQSATTNEIARSVNEAAHGSREIAENVTSVARAAAETADAAGRTRSMATGLTEVASDLKVVTDGSRSRFGQDVEVTQAAVIGAAVSRPGTAGDGPRGEGAQRYPVGAGDRG